MAKTKRVVQEYVGAVKALKEYFKCEDDIFLKALPEYNWSIRNDDEFYILTYWGGDKGKTDAIIVKKGGQPLIYKVEEHTMVVAIDCVKIGFVFHNANKKGSSK